MPSISFWKFKLIPVLRGYGLFPVAEVLPDKDAGDKRDADDVCHDAGNDEHQTADRCENPFEGIHFTIQVTGKTGCHAEYADDGGDGQEYDLGPDRINQKQAGTIGKYKGNNEGTNGQPCGHNTGLHRLGLCDGCTGVGGQPK